MEQTIHEMDLLRFCTTVALTQGQSYPVERAIAIISLDFLKSGWVYYRHGILPNGTLAKNEQYHKWDKPLDLMSYFAALAVLKPLMPQYQSQILQLILYYRALGIVVAGVTGSRKWYMLFVDVFKEFLFLFWIGASKNFFITVTAAKVWLEYNFHMRQEGFAGLFHF